MHEVELDGDRPEVVEITPEMVAVGADVLGDFDSGHNSPRDFARRTYLAMESARVGCAPADRQLG
jgi:hypothetical protein